MKHKDNSTKSIRTLTISLIISGTANVLLLFLLVYLVLNVPIVHLEKPAGLVEIPATYERSNGEVLRQFRLLPYDVLVQKLQDKTLIENGYTVRDLALASLVNFHSLDLERAVGNLASVRSLVIGKRQNGSYLTVKVYPGLIDKDFEKILFFLQTEKWPQNPQGLYVLLKKQNPSYDPSLIEAFVMTSEFRFLKQLMEGEHAPSQHELLQMMVEADWKVINEVVQKQQTGAAVRQQFLIKLLDKKSKIAAKLFVKTDGSFVAFRLVDAQLLTLLNLLDEKNSHIDLLRTRLLASPRSDAVLEAAKGLSSEPKPIPKFKESVYIVQEGDNLWKISRRFRVDVEKIKKQNRLESDKLKPGTSLRFYSE